MAIIWGCTGHTVDLLTATLAQIRTSVRACYPRLPAEDQESIAQTTYERALQLRGTLALIRQAGETIGDFGDSIGSKLVSQVGSSISAVSDTIRTSQAQVTLALASQIATQAAAQKSLIDQVTDGIGDAVSGAGSAISGIASKVTSGAQNVINQGAATVASLVNSAKASIGSVITAAQSAVGGFVTSAKTQLGTILSNAGTFINGVISQAKQGVADFLTGASAFLSTAYNQVRGALSQLVTNLAADISLLADRLLGIPGAIIGLADKIGDSLGGIGEGVVGGIGGFLLGPLAEVLTDFSKGKERAMADIVGDTVDRALSNSKLPDEYRPLLTSFRRPNHPIWVVLLAFALPIIGASAISTVLQPILQPAVQAEMAAVRPTLPSLPEAVGMFYRDIIDRAALNDIGAKLGYPNAVIQDSVELAQTQPSPLDLIDWRNRKIIADGAMRDRLSKLGYSDADVSAIDEASEIIPPLSDLVRFAVREAFPGQTAYDGARGSNVPGGFVEQAAKHGLPAESARSYWAAHWELPSVTAAFAMYHRRIISEAQLRALLREQDFAPEWVDKLIDVAFDPLTRVDVRRMFELGVLSKAEVVSAYLDLGYSKTNAERLADFVEADAKASESPRQTVERDLTRADLVGAYADGILSRAKAQTALQSIGYDANESALILDREDLRQIRSERKETRSAIVNQAVLGVIDFNEANSKLLAAGYTTDETDAALREIQRKIDAEARQPTKADLVAFRKARLITNEEYAAELRRLGYAERYVEMFVKLPAASTPSG